MASLARLSSNFPAMCIRRSPQCLQMCPRPRPCWRFTVSRCGRHIDQVCRWKEFHPTALPRRTLHGGDEDHFDAPNSFSLRQRQRQRQSRRIRMRDDGEIDPPGFPRMRSSPPQHYGVLDNQSPVSAQRAEKTLAPKRRKWVQPAR
ncbi:unnamed protein product [Diplocarpon coronariae]